jgi:hypothetical protein
MKATRLQRLQEKARKRNAVEPTPVAEPASEKPISQDRHFTANEVAALWHMHPSTIRRIFGGVIGVIKYGVGKYRTLYIPARLLEEVHQGLAA